MNQINDKIWILGQDLISLAQQTPKDIGIDLLFANDCESLVKSIGKKEKISFIARLQEKNKLEKILGKRAATKILYSGPLNVNSFLYHLNLAKNDLSLNKNIQFAEDTFVKDKTKIDSIKIQILEKIILQLLNAQSIEKINEVLLSNCKKIVPIKKIILQTNPPSFHAEKINTFHLAIPIYSKHELLAHIYSLFLDDNENAIDAYSNTLSDLLLLLSETIALVLQRNIILENIKKSNLIWEASFDAVADPLVVLSKDLRIIKANTAYLKLAKKKKLLFSKAEILPYLHYPSSEWEYTIGKKYYRVYLDKSIPKENIQHFILRLHDITNEKLIRERMLARQQVADLGVLISSVAHDINNPMAGILAYTQILQKKIRNNDTYFSDIVSMQEAAERCKRITQTMLSLVRKSENEKVELSLSSCIQDVVLLLLPEAKRLKVKMELKKNELGNDLILVNKTQLLHLFFHLFQERLQNIATYKLHLKKRKILFTIHIQKKEQELVVLIEDNAIASPELEDSSIAFNVVKILLESIGGKLSSVKKKSSYVQRLVFQTS